MNARRIWKSDRSAAMIANDDPSGAPFLGTVKRLDLLDGTWLATSSLYAVPRELGVYDTDGDAMMAVVRDAELLAERRAHALKMAAEMRAINVQRVTGAGRSTVHPTGWLERVAPGAGRRSRKAREATA